MRSFYLLTPGILAAASFHFYWLMLILSMYMNYFNWLAGNVTFLVTKVNRPGMLSGIFTGLELKRYWFSPGDVSIPGVVQE
jgi:hypothetical protein